MKILDYMILCSNHVVGKQFIPNWAPSRVSDGALIEPFKTDFSISLFGQTDSSTRETNSQYCLLKGTVKCCFHPAQYRYYFFLKTNGKKNGTKNMAVRSAL